MSSPSHSIPSIQSAEHNRGESQRRSCQTYSVPARDFVSQAPLFHISFRAAIARESDREGEHQHQTSKYRSVQSDGAAPKRSEAERKQARGLSQATSLASCVQVPPDSAWPLVYSFHSGRRLFSQAFPSNIRKCYGANYHSEMPIFTHTASRGSVGLCYVLSTYKSYLL